MNNDMLIGILIIGFLIFATIIFDYIYNLNEEIKRIMSEANEKLKKLSTKLGDKDEEINKQLKFLEKKEKEIQLIENAWQKVMTHPVIGKIAIDLVKGKDVNTNILSSIGNEEKLDEDLYNDPYYEQINLNSESKQKEEFKKGPNEKQQATLDIIRNTNQNIFLTGEAGTGKSFVIEEFTKDSNNKKFVLLAPTGTAALNIEGQTIHRFFHLSPSSTLEKCKPLSGEDKKLLEKLDTIIIDEISMVRADMFDIIEKIMRETMGNGQYFGGKQIIIVGDPYQLPPIAKTDEEKKYLSDNGYKSAYFFDSHSYINANFHKIALTDIVRQKDKKFISILNNIRAGIILDSDVIELNKSLDKNIGDDSITVTSTNNIANEINKNRLEKLTDSIYCFEASILGDIKPDEYPTDKKLELKKGARIMTIKNHSELLYSNGSLGKIIEIHDDKMLIKFDHRADTVMIEREEWKIEKPVYDENTKTIKHKEIGKFIQFPVKLAWAITIHKSQGKSLEKVNVNLGERGAFACGQTYVALSRCKSLNGLSLSYLLKNSDIKVDPRIINFMEGKTLEIINEQTLDEKIKIINKSIEDMKILKFEYESYGGEKNIRKVTINSIKECIFNGYKYLGARGFDEIKKEMREFKIDKMMNVSLSE